MKKHRFLFAVSASILIVVFVFAVNIITSPGYLWFVYPTFATAWWPLSVLLAKKDTIKLYSAVMSVLTIGFLALINFMHFTGYIWFYYPAFAIAWWPLSILLAKRDTTKLYSAVMSLLTIGFLALINFMHTPQTIWFHNAIFYVAWWPVLTYLGRSAATVGFAFSGAALIISYHTMLYYALTPGIYPWHLCIIPPAVLWPIGIAIKQRTKKAGIITLLTFATVLYYFVLNFIVRYDWVMSSLLKPQ